MKGLRKVLTPFAPDQSGVVSVLYELGGILVICDAGGCVGNICGFDEPRWFKHKGAVFSAGLRDMDAIMGRDDQLVKKLSIAAGNIDAKFSAMIGTPVPAVIGTDYRALARMAEKKTGLPAIAIDTTGTNLYDKGEEKAWRQLFEKFAMTQIGDCPQTVSRLGVIGMTPLSLSNADAGSLMQEALKDKGYGEIDCYGMGAGLDRIETAFQADENLVVSPAGYSTAKWLEEKAGTPFKVWDPLAEVFMKKALATTLADIDLKGKKVLIIDQQVSANTMRSMIGDQADVTVGNWFMEIAELKKEQDVALREEDQFTELVMDGGYDLIIGDPLLWELIPEFKGIKLDKPHFALSGTLI